MDVSLRSAMFERLHVPRMFVLFCKEWLGLSSRHTQYLWRALSHSQHTRVIAMRTAIQCSDALPYHREGLEHFARHHLAPQGLVAVLDILVEDTTLTRHEANMYQDAVLWCMDQHGRWKEESN